MRGRILRGVIPAVLVLFVLVAMRGPGRVVVKPYEVGWCVWVFAIVVTGIGLGWGLRSAYPGRRRR